MTREIKLTPKYAHLRQAPAAAPKVVKPKDDGKDGDGAKKAKGKKVEEREREEEAEAEEEEASAAAVESEEEEEREEEREEEQAAAEEEEEEDCTPKGKKKAKTKGKKVEEENDDDDAEMAGNGPAASARRRERERCSAIFSTPAAGKYPEAAAKLAFHTSLSRNEAIDVLNGLADGAPAVSSKSNFAARMAGANIQPIEQEDASKSGDLNDPQVFAKHAAKLADANR